MSALDIFVILALGGGALVGFVRGFVHELLSLFAWAAAIAMLKLFHSQLQEGLTAPVGTSAGAAVLAFALLFLPTFILVRLLARNLGKRSRASLLGPVDRVLGSGFGLLKGLLAATLFFLLANLATDMVYGRALPIWARPYTVGPQTYIVMRCGLSGTNGRFSRVMVS